MRTQKTHIFLTGATGKQSYRVNHTLRTVGSLGYIGGSVLARLLSHPLSDTFQTTVLVRSESKAKQFRTLGVKAVVGSLSDLPQLRQLAGEADIVFACADADDLDAAKAILSGLKDRFEKTAKVPSLIHTSGTGVLIDHEQGMHSTKNVYSDLDIAKLETLAPTQPHRNVDLTLVEADGQGYVKTYIILPSTIYGIASGPLVDLDLQNAHSIQIPALIKASLDRGQGGMIGQGKNVWSNVHIDDVSDIYILLFDLIVSPKPSGTPAHGRLGFYFAENGEHTLHEVGKAIAKALFDLGKGKSANPTTFIPEEMNKYFPGGTSLGTNSRCKAERGRKLGWKPKRSTRDMLASVKDEII